MLEDSGYGTSGVFPCTGSRQSVTSLLELCQSHTTCSPIVLTLGRAVKAAASGHAAAAARQFLQLAEDDFLFVFPHQLEAELKMHIYRQMCVSV